MSNVYIPCFIVLLIIWCILLTWAKLDLEKELKSIKQSINGKWFVNMCDCEYKAHCYLGRQHTIASQGRSKNQCEFYGMFNQEGKL